MSPMDEEDRLIESLKLEFEWHKHLTTLISGIVVAIVTVIQAFFAVGENGRPYSFAEVGLLVYCPGSLFVALFMSINAMNQLILWLRDAEEEPNENWKKLSRGYPLLFLVTGIAGFVGFALLRTGILPTT